MVEEKQNLTLALPKRLLRRAKVVAAEQETSVSAILQALLAEHVERHDGTAEVRAAALQDMRKGLGYRIDGG